MALLGRLRLLRFMNLRRTASAIELDLAQQWIVLTLSRFGDCGFARLQAEVDAIRGATQAEVVVAVIKLEQEHVLERLNPRTEGRQTSTYRLTTTGRKAGRLIPRPPRSPITVYL